MFAVIRTGGKQYTVAKDDVIAVEKLDGEPGATVELGEVLMVGDGADVSTGTPLLAGATVSATLVEQRRADKITADGLRSFMAILGDQDVGIFVSTGGFTSGAEMEARTKETRKVTLIDLEKLVELWIEHYDRIAESDKRLLPLKPVHYLAPID